MIESVLPVSPSLAAIADLPWAYYLAPVGGIAALIMAMTSSRAR
jgi:hypothetical protein